MKNKRTKQSKFKEKMTTILEEESDEEDHITNKQNIEQPIKQKSEEESTDNTESEKLAPQEEMPQTEEVPPRRDMIQQENRIQCRGERQRHKNRFLWTKRNDLQHRKPELKTKSKNQNKLKLNVFHIRIYVKVKLEPTLRHLHLCYFVKSYSLHLYINPSISCAV